MAAVHSQASLIYAPEPQSRPCFRDRRSTIQAKVAVISNPKFQLRGYAGVSMLKVESKEEKTNAPRSDFAVATLSKWDYEWPADKARPSGDAGRRKEKDVDNGPT